MFMSPPIYLYYMYICTCMCRSVTQHEGRHLSTLNGARQLNLCFERAAAQNVHVMFVEIHVHTTDKWLHVHVHDHTFTENCAPSHL